MSQTVGEVQTFGPVICGPMYEYVRSIYICICVCVGIMYVCMYECVCSLESGTGNYGVWGSSRDVFRRHPVAGGEDVETGERSPCFVCSWRQELDSHRHLSQLSESRCRMCCRRGKSVCFTSVTSKRQVEESVWEGQQKRMYVLSTL
jgi:hypothetical protein